jgi:FkbM family methyltransferase
MGLQTRRWALGQRKDEEENPQGHQYITKHTPSTHHQRFWYVDLGTHNGGDAKDFLQQNPHYTPILVETNPIHHVPLRRLCAQYNGGVYLNAAAWIRNEMLEFQIFPSDDDHASSILDISPNLGDKMRYHASVVMVHAFDLAQYLRETVAESDILRIRMDVQGAEYELLRHLLASGMACRIDTLIVEFHAMHTTDTFQYVALDGALP